MLETESLGLQPKKVSEIVVSAGLSQQWSSGVCRQQFCFHKVESSKVFLFQNQ